MLKEYTPTFKLYFWRKKIFIIFVAWCQDNKSLYHATSEYQINDTNKKLKCMTTNFNIQVTFFHTKYCPI